MNEQMGVQGPEAPSRRPCPPQLLLGQACREHSHFLVTRALVSRGTGCWERVRRGIDLRVRELRGRVIGASLAGRTAAVLLLQGRSRRAGREPLFPGSCDVHSFHLFKQKHPRQSGMIHSSHSDLRELMSQSLRMEFRL